MASPAHQAAQALAPEDRALALAVPEASEVPALVPEAPVSLAALDSREVPEVLDFRVAPEAPAPVRVPEELAAPAPPQDARPAISRPNREAADFPSWQ